MKCRFALLGALALAACNSQPPPLTPTEYCNQYAQDVCAGVSPICLIPQASCMTTQLQVCTLRAQENVGRDFLPPNAAAHLGKVNAAYSRVQQDGSITASDFQAMEQARSRVYRGTIMANAACLSDADCLDGLICDKGFCGTLRVVAPGAQCANIGETCPQGSYCSNATGIWVCTQSQLDFGEACSSDQDCSSGFCEPYAALCAQDVRFANGNPDCVAMKTPSP